jgi:hypothetical protein
MPVLRPILAGLAMSVLVWGCAEREGAYAPEPRVEDPYGDLQRRLTAAMDSVDSAYEHRLIRVPFWGFH